MESNALPGWTNRVLARFIDKAAVSFDTALAFFRGKGVVTGNPVRREFFEITQKQRDPAQLSILIFGGSQGAHAINQAMVAALPLLAEVKARLRVTHQTGEADYEQVASGYANSGWNEQASVRKYIDDMVAAFAAADLVISRAGATTTAELIAAGKASLMIPFPLAADDHQRKNAEAMEASGAAKMILQQDLSPQRLASEIETLVGEPAKVTAMENAARALRRGDAAAKVVELVEEMVKTESRSQ
jgi:UDP-N-acetylglucosamine--N-acetylmuramyl-(pentapeptide) pyrophosphoryl-undecaprenol N-acetylglucosamine transferase